MKFYGLLLAILLTFGGWAQPINRPSTEHYLSAFLATTGSEAGKASFTRYLAQLEAKKSKMPSEQDFVRYVFYSTHKKYLKRFTPQTSFASVFENGNYNCLTGTILYSLILSEFNIRHQVIETNYHIFVLVNSTEGELLIEATDPQNGFVTGDTEITDRIERYKASLPLRNNNHEDLNYYHFSFDLYNPVTPDELTGLLYYNLAIEAYNKQNIQQAVSYLGEAIARYSSPRIEEMARLLLLTVHESNLSAGEKSAFKKTLQTIRYKALPVVAGLQP